jgi:hypothetical protein
MTMTKIGERLPYRTPEIATISDAAGLTNGVNILRLDSLGSGWHGGGRAVKKTTKRPAKKPASQKTAPKPKKAKRAGSKKS